MTGEWTRPVDQPAPSSHSHILSASAYSHMSPTLMVKAPSTGGMETHRPEPWWSTCILYAHVCVRRITHDQTCRSFDQSGQVNRGNLTKTCAKQVDVWDPFIDMEQVPPRANRTVHDENTLWHARLIRVTSKDEAANCQFRP